MEDRPGNGRDRRQFQRLPLEGAVTLYARNGSWPAELADLSLRGVLVHRPANCPAEPGARFRMDLRVFDSLPVSMGVALVRADDTHLAFTWDRMDLDSFARLKRVLELNLPQPELLYRELAELQP